jgi:hypothetical protein
MHQVAHTDGFYCSAQKEIFYLGTAYNKYTQVHTFMIVETLVSLAVIF